jgi:hypothetical protein
MENFQRVKRAGPVADQPSRLRTPPGVGPRCRRLGSQVNAPRWENLLALEGEGRNERAWKEHYMLPAFITCAVTHL